MSAPSAAALRMWFAARSKLPSMSVGYQHVSRVVLIGPTRHLLTYMRIKLNESKAHFVWHFFCHYGAWRRGKGGELIEV